MSDFGPEPEPKPVPRRYHRCVSCGAPIRGDEYVDEDGSHYHGGCYQP